MKDRLQITLPLIVSLLVLTSTALASTTWYVNGVSGSDSNNCTSATTACKTIGHAVSLAASGDSIKVSAATYAENLGIGISLKLIGSGARTTIVDGGGIAQVISTSTGTNITVSGMTLRNGHANYGGGIANWGTLTVTNSAVTGNTANWWGGGIINYGRLTINKSTISGNAVVHTCIKLCFFWGGGIFNDTSGTLIINNSTLSGNSARAGGAIYIFDSGHRSTISNSTVAGNTGGGISFAGGLGTMVLQNSIVANNSAGNCFNVTSNGYNLSSDSTCNFSGPGDTNNTDPQLGPLQYNGGPTQTMALPSGSPAVDAGNPSGCTDGSGHLLKTDQRSMPRPDPEDKGGCDMGAYESQRD